jgi:hypothetical protein
MAKARTFSNGRGSSLVVEASEDGFEVTIELPDGSSAGIVLPKDDAVNVVDGFTDCYRDMMGFPLMRFPINTLGGVLREGFEIVYFDPDNAETYPSVCATPDEVKDRFGFTGGEKLLFTDRGAYVGQIAKELSPRD